MKRLTENKLNLESRVEEVVNRTKETLVEKGNYILALTEMPCSAKCYLGYVHTMQLRLYVDLGADVAYCQTSRLEIVCSSVCFNGLEGPLNMSLCI